MESYGVLVVDDSALMRKVISEIIEACPKLHIVGKARNGLDAIEKIKRLRPAIVTLDIEMPELDGIETLKLIMDQFTIPVVMLANGAESLIEAIELGAVDFVLKKELIRENNSIYFEQFYKTLIAAATANIEKNLIRQRIVEQEKQKMINEEVMEDVEHDRIIIFGSSTGGPAALQQILTQFPANFPLPIFVIQHMPPGFTRPLAERFNNICLMRVKEAENNEVLLGGTIYIAPAGLQTTLHKTNVGKYITKQSEVSQVDSLYKPSIDVTLLSLKGELTSKLVTIILTGMGDDGLRGCKAIKKQGAKLIAQSADTCVVYGMPKVVQEAGIVDKQLPLNEMYKEILAMIEM